MAVGAHELTARCALPLTSSFTSRRVQARFALNSATSYASFSLQQDAAKNEAQERQAYASVLASSQTYSRRCASASSALYTHFFVAERPKRSAAS